MRLARVGYENIQGILDGGYPAWVNSGYQIDKGNTIEPSELKKLMENGIHFVMDVRGPGEQKTAGYVEGIVNIELDILESTLKSPINKIPKD